VCSYLAGNSTLDDLMMHLLHTIEMFRQQLDADIIEEVSGLNYYVTNNTKFATQLYKNITIAVIFAGHAIVIYVHCANEYCLSLINTAVFIFYRKKEMRENVCCRNKMMHTRDHWRLTVPRYVSVFIVYRY